VDRPTTPDEELPIDGTVAALDDAGGELGLLSAWHAPREGPLIANDEVAGWVTQHPERLAGLAAVNLDKPMDAVRELRRCITGLGFKGLRVVPRLWDAALADRRYYPLYAACVELGVPFCTQVGHTGPLRPSETGRPIPYLAIASGARLMRRPAEALITACEPTWPDQLRRPGPCSTWIPSPPIVDARPW
jgi:predicted TIM-barrel fold metal-dependent hydrolase